MAATLFAFFTGSTLARYIAAGGLTVLMVYFYARARGRNAERARQKAERLRQLRDRIKTDDEISRMHPDARRREFGEWVRG